MHPPRRFSSTETTAAPGPQPPGGCRRLGPALLFRGPAGGLERSHRARAGPGRPDWGPCRIRDEGSVLRARGPIPVPRVPWVLPGSRLQRVRAGPPVRGPCRLAVAVRSRCGPGPWTGWAAPARIPSPCQAPAVLREPPGPPPLPPVPGRRSTGPVGRHEIEALKGLPPEPLIGGRPGRPFGGLPATGSPGLHGGFQAGQLTVPVQGSREPRFRVSTGGA
jgi:hypothetical protein